MSELTLWYSPGACSRVPMIQLEEAGAEYALRRVNAQKGETRTESFRRLNAKGKVPVLVEGSQVLTENVAIANRLAQLFPRAGLLPKESFALSEALSLLAWCTSGLHPLIGRMRLPRRVCDLDVAQDRIKELAEEEMTAQLSYAEKRLNAHAWLLGSNWCSADAYFFWVCSRAQDSGFDLSRSKGVAAHHARMLQRSSVQRAIARETADSANI